MRHLVLLAAFCWLASRCDLDVKLQLVELFHKVINPDVIKNAYKRTKSVPADQDQIIAHVADVTTKEFSEASSAIRNIQKTAEQAYQKHTWSKTLENSFWNAFTDPISSTNGSYLPVTWINRYKGNVSLSYSAVNLPIDVFPNWTDVKNTIQWTKGLNQAFTENYHHKPVNIFWQYLGTPQGIMRSYPASFIEEKQRFTFDVRHRPWYNEGIGCPKDVVLLIDTSGSLEGFPSKLLKTTARKMIELILSDSDFVAAIGVGTSARYLTCNGLLQRAELAVKKRLTAVIDDFPPSGTSNWTQGIMMAFQSYRRSKEAGLTAGCRRVMVIFSDETSQDLDKVIVQYDPERSVRVYVFSFKRNEGLFQDKLDKLACLYNGVYKKILYFGQIGNALQNIVQAETMHLYNEEIRPTWSNVYKDLNGFGFVVTVTLPVVVATSLSERIVTEIEFKNSVSFLGVVGLDFKTDAIITKASSTLPLNTALILINNKGYPIHHDKLEEYAWSDVTTKLQDFQYSAEGKEDLRFLEEKMMQQEHATVKTRGLFSVQSKIRGSNTIQDITYQTAKVEGTPFSLAISYTDYPVQYRVVDTPTISLSQIRRRLEDWRENNGILTKLHKFSCNGSQVIHRLLRGMDTDHINDEFKFEGSSYCNTKIFSVLTDLMISDQFRESFLKSPDLNILGRYVITYNGLVFFDNKQWNSTDRSDLKSLSPFAKVMKNLTDVTYYVGLPTKRGCFDFETINVTQKIVVGGKLVAAAGFEMELDSFKENVFRSTRADPNLESEISLVDENGYMIAEDPSQRSSKFLGEEHPYLLEELIKRGVYTKKTHVECIRECANASKLQTPIPVPTSSASHPLSILSKSLRTITLLIHILWHAFLFTLVKPQTHYEYNTNLLSEQHQDSIRAVECCQEFTHYERDFSVSINVALSIPRQCDCGTSYTVSPIPETNLLSLKRGTNPYCGCRAQSVSLSEGRETIVYQMCYNSTYQHQFRPSKTCILDQGTFTAPGCSSSGDNTFSTIHSQYFTLLAMLYLLAF